MTSTSILRCILRLPRLASARTSTHRVAHDTGRSEGAAACASRRFRAAPALPVALLALMGARYSLQTLVMTLTATDSDLSGEHILDEDLKVSGFPRARARLLEL